MWIKWISCAQKLIKNMVNIINMNSRKKGQLEFIVIVALIIIAITAVILVSRQAVVPTPPPSGIPEEAKTIKDSVTNLIRAGVKEKLALIYNQGGVLKPASALKVNFGAFDTAVWSACGETMTPDISKEIGAGILAYLRENLKDNMEFYGKNVKFDFSKSKYEVGIIKNRVNIRVYLPTKVETYEIEQPYEISVDTKLYDVLDFSKNFVNDTGKTRFFEVVTLASMAHSNPDNENWVPVAGIQTGCGNTLFKTRSQLLPGIKGIIKYTVSHVVWNAIPPRLAENPFYPINNVGGKLYPGLQVAFAYPPSWDSEIDKYFMFSPEPLRIIPKPTVPLIPLCLAPYSVAYTFRYPVVVMVEDSTLNQWFKFAMMVDIQNTQPGDCSAQLGNLPENVVICSTEAKCKAKITVKDTAGSPIQGADAGFYVCDIGTTNEKGVAEGNIPCMISELHVYKSGYTSFGELLASGDIKEDKEKTVTLKKVRDNLTIHFKGLETWGKPPKTTLSNGMLTYSYYEIKSSSQDITNFRGLPPNEKNLTIILTFSPVNPNIFTDEISPLTVAHYVEDDNLVSEYNVSGLQPTSYNVTATIAASIDLDSETTKITPVGYINTSFELKEDVKDIYVYLPFVKDSNGEDLPEPGIDPSEADKLTSAVSSKCGKVVSDSSSSSC